METMTVKQLTEKLAEFDDDLPVVLVDEYEVCFQAKAVGKKNMSVIKDAITNAIGFLYETDDDDEHCEVLYIGCCDDYD